MKRNSNYNFHDHAVSETVGYIIIFAIMMTGISLITLYGYPALMSEQSNANIKNMENNMIVLQNDIKSLAFKSVPYKETTIQVSGGTLSVKNPATAGGSPRFEITYSNVTDSYVMAPPFYPGELHFESDNGEAVVILENGGVIIRYWSSPTGSAMISDPRWFYDSTTKTMVIPLIKIHSDTSLAQTGIGTVQMSIKEEAPIELSYNSGQVAVTYIPDITNHHLTAWQNNYFAKLGLPQSNVDNLIIKRYDITIIGL